MAMLTQIVPSPKGFCGEEHVRWYVPVLFFGDYEESANTFCEYAKKGLDLDVSMIGSAPTADAEGIYLITDTSFAQGEYKIISGNNGKICIYASDREGIRYALATLLQMGTKVENKLQVQAGTVWDQPESTYRGLMIDCARSCHALPLLLEYIDMCWLYKVKYLQLHFSDDEAYTLPSKIFPDVTSADRCYTCEEIERLRAYARARDVQLVPEIDAPGHAAYLQKKYPQVFGDKGIICFHEKTIKAMQSLYQELCELFPESEYIHIGGDEGRLGWWLDCDECIRYGRSLGYKEENEAPGIPCREYVMLQYLGHFIAKMAQTVLDCGKKPIVWEGFPKYINDMIPREVTVMVWDGGFQTAQSLLQSGFSIINCSWIPNYIVTPTWYYSTRNSYNWDVYSFGSISEGSAYYNNCTRIGSTDAVLGGQLHAWGDTVEKAFPSLKEGLADEQMKIRQRLPYVMENTWNRDKRVSYDRMLEASAYTDALCARIIGK